MLQLAQGVPQPVGKSVGAAVEDKQTMSGQIFQQQQSFGSLSIQTALAPKPV